MGAEIEGMDKLGRVLDGLTDKIIAAAARGMNRWSETTMTEAKRRTPVDTGELRASGQVEAPQISGTQVEQTLGFGNEAVGYALTVHENLQAHHDTGQAKFLESAAIEREGRLQEDVSREIRDAIR